MKKVEITGVAKVEAAYNEISGYGSIKINGHELEKILAQKLIEKSKEKGWAEEIFLCTININIEPYVTNLCVDGEEIPLEL